MAAKFGITQSGSRYESGRSIPEPLMILLRMHYDGIVTDEMLEGAKR